MSKDKTPDIQILRQYHHPDRLVKPNDAESTDGMHLRWVDKRNFDSRKCDGYIPVSGKEGTIERSDLILMQIPEKDYQEKRENINYLTRLQANSLGVDEVDVRKK